MDSLDNHNDMDKKEPIKLAKKTCLVRKRDLSEGQNMFSLLEEGVKEIIMKAMDDISQDLALQPEWLDQIDSYVRPTDSGNLEEGYVLYFDGDNKHGNKSIVEIDTEGNVSHEVFFKK